MAKMELTTKKVQINKAQASMVGMVAAAVFVAVFSLVSAKSLWTQRGYQARVIAQKEKARDQLEENVKSVSSLVTAYKEFVSTPTNIIDGNPNGTGDKDGDNARIILDALPSKYDFPALTSSLEKILTDRGFKIDGITGTDDEIAQSSKGSSGNPEPVEMPIQIAVTGSLDSIKDLVGVLEKSIRPFDTQKINLSGSNSSLKMVLDVKTYYQPEKSLQIKKEDVQ